jgi:hypothetical protein
MVKIFQENVVSQGYLFEQQLIQRKFGFSLADECYAPSRLQYIGGHTYLGYIYKPESL